MGSPDAAAPRDDLAGRVALVTGGGRGLGRGYAEALAGAGAAVAVAARSDGELAETVELIQRRGGRASAFRLDVADGDSVAAAVAAVEAELGPVDLLVNNAGVMPPAGRDWELDPALWWRTFEVNVRGPYLCARAVLPGMIARRRGRIVNISSHAAFATRPPYAGYAASKAALTHWTRSLAVGLEEHGVAVFAYSPGLVRTAMTASAYRSQFDEGRGTPLERAVGTFMLLASGRADALTGRHFQADDDIADLARRAASIRRDDGYVGYRRA